jgi:hypothetical protein
MKSCIVQFENRGSFFSFGSLIIRRNESGEGGLHSGTSKLLMSSLHFGFPSLSIRGNEIPLRWIGYAEFIFRLHVKYLKRQSS